MKIRAIALSLALGAAPFAVAAQDAQTPSQEANPHDTKNKDRPSAGKGSNAAVQQGETANPHSVENKDAKPTGEATTETKEEAQAGSPHSVRHAKQRVKKTQRVHRDGGVASPDAGTPEAR